MRKFINLAVLSASAALIPFAALAADAAPPSALQAFFDRVRMKISMLTPTRSMTATTAVGGVRGLDVHAEDVYWKGENRASAQEISDFQMALGDAQAGRNAEAMAGMRRFLVDHPKSALAPEASAALDLLQGR